jgi:hypothetical protein
MQGSGHRQITQDCKNAGWGGGGGATQPLGHNLESAVPDHVRFTIRTSQFWRFECVTHWLNMELYLQSLFGLLCTAVLIGWDPATPPLRPLLGSYTRALLVSQDKRHLFVTTWCHMTPLYCMAERILMNNFYSFGSGALSDLHILIRPYLAQGKVRKKDMF